MSKKLQSGRSLVEMLGVLALIGIVVLSSIFLFNTLFQSYQRTDTVKQMDNLVTRYRSAKLVRKRNGQVLLKDLVPGATGNSLKSTDGGSFTLIDGESSSFVIMTNQLGLSCRDIVEQGNYDAVAYGDTPLDSSSLTSWNTNALTPNDVKSSTNYEAQLAAICNEHPYQFFMYSKDGSGNAKYVIDGKPSECKAGEVLAKDPDNPSQNKCCAEDSVNICGFCEKCPSGKTCNPDTKQCENPDCPGYEECPECFTPGSQEGCKDKGNGNNCWCTESLTCECCDLEFEEWNGYTCVCKSEKPKLTEKCSAECGCDTGLTCSNGVCVNPGDEECTVNAENKTLKKTCKNSAGECDCCSPSHWDGSKCLDCSQNFTTGLTRFDETLKKCTCEEGYVWDDFLKKCIPDMTQCKNIPEGVGDSCSAICPCPSPALSCEGTCQCGSIPKKKNAICAPDCGCGNAFLCDCTDRTKCASGKCVCPKDEDLPQKGEACNTDCGCFNGTAMECKDSTCQCPSTPAKEAEACVKDCPCEKGIPCTDGKCCPAPTGRHCVADQQFAKYPKCTQKIKINCADTTDKDYNPNKTVCNPTDGQCVQCMVNTDCPENQYCTANHVCKPCGPKATNPFVDSIRGKTEEHCRCPKGYSIYCGSTGAGTSTACSEGNYICRPRCQQTSDCDENEFCYKNPVDATYGDCKPCAEGEFRKTGETECHGCNGCERLNDKKDGCVKNCKNDEACLMQSCSAKTAGGACQVTSNTWACKKQPKLKEIRGTTVGGKFYIPPAEAQYRFYQPDAARFCESYGMRLATIQEACGKDWAYDSGYDCKNISSLNLSQYHTTGSGSFWMDAQYGAACSALTITYSCGNNHEHPICGEKFYPLCYGGYAAAKCAKNVDCAENKYCNDGKCKPCGPDGTSIRNNNEEFCHCPEGLNLMCGSDQKGWRTNCKEGEYVCKASCVIDTNCPANQQCQKEQGETLGKCVDCPSGLIRSEDEQQCHGCSVNTDCAENKYCKKEHDHDETGLCKSCPMYTSRAADEDSCHNWFWHG